MERPIQSITWKRADDEQPTDVTDRIASGVLIAKPHPDDDIEDPKGYTVKLTLRADSQAFAEALQHALMDLDPPRVTLQLEGLAAPVEDLPVNVSKVPYPGDGDDAQPVAEMGVKPEAHERLHEHFRA
jgi:hypothetical protein